MAIIENSFATANAGSGATGTASAFIPTLWSDGVVEAAQFAGVIQKRVNLDFQDDLKIGATLNIPRLSNLNTQTKASGPNNTITFEATSESTQTIQITNHEYAAFMVESVVQVQANQDLRARYERKIGYALARGREQALATRLGALSTNNVGTYNVEMTADDYVTAWTTLATAGLLENDVTPGDDYSLILSNQAYAALLKVEQFINQLYVGQDPQAIDKAKVGDIYGVPVYRSNLLGASGGGHQCAMFHKECFALIVQEEIPVQSQYLIRNLADGVVGWNLYGTAVVLFPPETPPTLGNNPETTTAADNRGILVKTV